MSELVREQVRDYLLGALDEDRQHSFEELLVTDGSLFDELLIAEDELTDQYLANGLSESERNNFERHFLCAPERLQKLRFARVLRTYVSNAAETTPEAEDEPSLVPFGDRVERSSRKRPFFSFLPIQNPVIAYSLVAAVLVGVIGISWFVFTNLTNTTQRPGSVLAVNLTPGITRGSGERTNITIPPGTGSVQLQLVLTSDEDQTYRAELLTSDRDSVLVNDDLKPEATTGHKVISVTVPAKLLKRDDYRVNLSRKLPNGSYEDIDTYVFRVN